MRIIVRPADLEQDRDLLVSTLHQYLTPTSNHSRFDWLYRENPHGPTRVWLALDGDSGEIVGSSAAFARRLTVQGTTRDAWVLGDFCIADKYRSLGPALQLQRVTLQAIQDQAGFCYDFPSQRLAATYRRLGINPGGQMVRLTKILRLDQKLEQLLHSRALAKPASLLANLVLHLSDVTLPGNSGWELAIHAGDCGQEFTDLEKSLPAADGIEVQRSAEYLNWRYLKHPLIHHQILTARKDGILKGYLIFSRPDENAQIAEWRVGDDHRLLAVMLARLIRLLRQTSAMTVNAYLLNGDPRFPHLKKMGFWPRESTPVMMYGPGRQDVLSSNWLLMNGDRDS